MKCMEKVKKKVDYIDKENIGMPAGHNAKYVNITQKRRLQ